MFSNIDSFNMLFFPALALIVAAILKEEKLAEILSKKRGKDNEIKHH